MSCDTQMRRVATAAAGNGIAPVASRRAYVLGRYPSLPDIYTANLRATDVRDFTELYEYLRYGKLPNRKERTTGSYVLAGMSTAVTLIQLRRRRKQLQKLQAQKNGLPSLDDRPR